MINKEEILAASRQENRNQDLAEIESLKQASKTAYIVGCLLCVLVCLIQWRFLRTINWGCWVVNFSILGTVFLVKSKMIKRKRDIALAMIYYSLCLFFFVGFVMSMKG